MEEVKLNVPNYSLVVHDKTDCGTEAQIDSSSFFDFGNPFKILPQSHSFPPQLLR